MFFEGAAANFENMASCPETQPWEDGFEEGERVNPPQVSSLLISKMRPRKGRLTNIPDRATVSPARGGETTESIDTGNQATIKTTRMVGTPIGLVRSHLGPSTAYTGFGKWCRPLYRPWIP